MKGRGGKRKVARRKAKRAARPSFGSEQQGEVVFNYVTTSARGCHIAHGDADWVIGRDHFNPDEWDEVDRVPDLSLDPETLLLTAINTTNRFKSFFISFPYPATGHGERPLQMGVTCTDGKEIRVITLIAILFPLQVIDLCKIELPSTVSMGDIDLRSDMKELPDGWDFSCLEMPVDVTHKPLGPFRFPLLGKGPYLCSQGTHGGFTHFYPQTCFAVDLECPEGTPIIAVGDGEVTEIIQHHCDSGIRVDNLFKWNSITLRLADDTIAEYVHIQANSVTVKVGDKVTEGQVICHSGAVGFCPTPHLHIQFHTSPEADAPTVPFLFFGASEVSGEPDPDEDQVPLNLHPEPFCPQAGRHYCPLPSE